MIKSHGKSIPMHYRTARAKRFYEDVMAIAREASTGFALEGRLALSIELSPPTRRVFDISNSVKCVEDALQESGIFLNDAQIDELHVRRLPKDETKNGFADVVIQPVG